MRRLFLFLLLISMQTNAQISKNTDSIFLVKNYLLDVQNTVNAKENRKQKIEKLTHFIRTATKKKAIFNRNIPKLVKNKREIEEMKTSPNFILQSMVLYKSDLQNNDKSQSEILYLNKNIPILINKSIIIANLQSENNTKTQKIKNAKPFP